MKQRLVLAGLDLSPGGGINWCATSRGCDIYSRLPEIIYYTHYAYESVGDFATAEKN